MTNEEMAMVEELEADVLKSQDKLAKLEETTNLLKQEILDVTALCKEGDPDFDASAVLVAELQAEMEKEMAKTAELKAEVAELKERRTLIQEMLRKYEQ
ncbi:MAG: hypothetical protein FWC76_05505 [Defluviitaleaceae bacterium]|nr:hypothetical protein [Defluviitaleaceae bacterium]